MTAVAANLRNAPLSIRTRCRFADDSTSCYSCYRRSATLYLSQSRRNAGDLLQLQKTFLLEGSSTNATSLDPITNIEPLDSVYIPRQICFYDLLARRP
jgi:hypothetical protein